MTPLHPDWQPGDLLDLTWDAHPEPRLSRVRSVDNNTISLLVDDGAVASLRVGELVHIARRGGGNRLHGRVLHLETRWHTTPGGVVRSPTLLVLAPRADLVEATQHRRFVRVPSDLEIELTVGQTRTRGQCEWLAARGLKAEVRGPVPQSVEAEVRVMLPSGDMTAHGLLLGNERVSGTRGLQTRHRIAIAFTAERPIDERLVSYVLGRGYTPVPACLAS